jgi:hypothetical protein
MDLYLTLNSSDNFIKQKFCVMLIKFVSLLQKSSWKKISLEKVTKGALILFSTIAKNATGKLIFYELFGHFLTQEIRTFLISAQTCAFFGTLCGRLEKKIITRGFYFFIYSFINPH